MSKEEAFHYAHEFIAVKRGRSKARKELAALRKQWNADTDSYFDPSERSQWCEELYPLADAIESALRAREACNKKYRSVLAKLDGQFGKGLIWQPSTGMVDLTAASRMETKTPSEIPPVQSPKSSE